MYRQALQRPARQTATQQVVPAPIRGLRSDKGLTAEQPGVAMLLTNWVPETDAVRLRRGYTDHVTGSSLVETLMPYNAAGDSALFAAIGTGIYDVTVAGGLGGAEVSDVGNAQFSHFNFTTAAGTRYLVACNGDNPVLNYDGTSWTEPVISGIDSFDLVFGWAFKTRQWFIELDSMSAWYLPVDSVAGSATEFPLGTLFKRGGQLMAAGSMSYDSGEGIDDLNVFITSEGEVAVYEMTDPDTVSTLALKGLYYIGRPIGRRCLFNVGGDLMILTKTGIIPLSKAISLDKAVLEAAAITAPIRREFADAAFAYGGNDGWQMVSFPETNIMIVNVPEEEGLESRQYIMNLLSNAWGLWTGINALCWAVFNDSLYFGGVDGVYEAETGSSDNGAAIQAELLTSYSQLGAPGRQKKIELIQPIIRSNATVNGGVQIAADYVDPTTDPNQSESVEISGFTWDVSNWDEANWAGTTVSKQWRSGTNIGTAIALHYAVTVTTSETSDLEFRLIGFNLIYNVGNPIG